MNRHRTGSFLSSIAFISLAIISCIFMFTYTAHAADVVETATYAYDDAGQVVRATYADGTVVDYLYDPMGNRMSMTVSSSSSNNPPNAPTGEQPATGALDMPLTVTFTWDVVTDQDGDAVIYDLYLGTTPTPGLYVSGVAQNSLTAYLQPSTTYYWQVVSRDSKNATTPGSVLSLTTAADTDGDRVVDSVDLCPLAYDPTNNDTDGDQVGDVCDICPSDSDPLQEDFDLDGIGDVCDDDDDNDTLLDVDDYCPMAYDPTNTDTDGDLIGNVCDDDDDNDTVLDVNDYCPRVYDPTNADTDGDQIGDVCDDDDDNDTVLDVDDYCPLVADPTNTDTDGDLTGDVCDDDDDNDTVLDVDDYCPLTYDPTNADTDGDQIGNVCDDDDDNDTVLDVDDYCPLVADPTNTDTDGDLTGDVCDDDDDNDTVLDVNDYCPLTYDPTNADTDGDLIGDVCDDDDDNDTVLDVNDYCPLVYDPTNTDTDGDLTGDVCDDDDDNDTVLDVDDYCPLVADPTNTDTDGDLTGDVCDDDDDNDTVLDVDDLCPLVADPTNTDTDGDQIGDVCDDDDDNDTVLDVDDLCPLVADPTNADTDGDGLGDVCELCPNDPINDDDGDGVCGLVDLCPTVADSSNSDSNGDGVGDACTVYHCVSNGSELDAAFLTARNNGMHDIIQMQQGIYTKGSGSFVYTSTSSEQYGIFMEGGYGNSCSTRDLNPENTVIVAPPPQPSTPSLKLDLYPPAYGGSQFKVEGLTITGSGVYEALLILNWSSNTNATITVANNVIRDVTNDALGVDIRDVHNSSSIVFVNNILANIQGSSGYSLYIQGRDVTVTNNTFTGNSQVIGLIPSGAYNFYNNIVWDNFSTYDIFFNGSANEVQSHNNVYDPSKVWFYVTPVQSNNILVDPWFVDPANGDYNLSLGSPVINMGTNSAPELPDNDLEDHPRIRDGVVDIGALEYNPVRASFTATPQSGTEPLLVQFYDASVTDTPGGTIDSWEWDLDSNGTVDSTIQNTSAYYAGSGTYSVTLKASDSTNGEYDTKIMRDYINVEGDVDNDTVGNWFDNCPNDYNPLQTDLDGDGIGYVCDAYLDLIHESRYIPDINYAWPDSSSNFVDVTAEMIGTGTPNQPPFVPEVPASRFVVYDAGIYDMLSFRTNINASELSEYHIHLYVNNLDGVQQDVAVFTYNADGDTRGNSYTNHTVVQGWNDLDVSGLLQYMGDYGFVKFRVIDGFETWFEVSGAYVDAVPINLAPVADAGPDVSSPPQEDIIFDGSASYDPNEPVGQIVSYDWDFGDGTSDSGIQVTKQYSQPGTYIVKLTVTDDMGATGRDFLTVTVTAPDLVVWSVSTPMPVDTHAQSPTDITVTGTVKNNGTAITATGGFWVNFYLSLDQDITTGDIYLGTYWMATNGGGIEPGQLKSFNVTVSIPEGVVGDYYIGAIADSTDIVQNESDETNNALAGNLTTVQATLIPDLVLTAVSVPAILNTNAQSPTNITVPYTVQNIGNGNSGGGGFWVEFYLSLDQDITTGDISLGTHWMTTHVIKGLEPGQLKSANAAVSIPEGVEGDYYIGAIVDTTDIVPNESNENNNALAGNLTTVQATLIPDLVLTAVSVPAILNTNAQSPTNITVPYTVQNIGNGNSGGGGFWVEFYLSLDQDITTGDISLGTHWMTTHVIKGLEPGESKSSNATVSIPPDVEGYYYIGAIVDTTDIVPNESNENNNANYGNLVTITITP